MSVRATTRREQIRRPNGDRVVLPGGQDATGLSALAAVSAGADTITGAARHAVHGDVVQPTAEAVILFESLRDTGATLGYAAALPAGVTQTYPAGVNVNIGKRRDNSGWGVTRCDVDLCDDPQSQAGMDYNMSNALMPNYDPPYVFTHATPLERCLPNAQADPAGTAWTLSRPPARINMFPSPSAESGGIPTIWRSSVLSGAVSNVATGGFAGSRFLRLTANGTGFMAFGSENFGQVEPGQQVTAQIRLKGTAGVVVNFGIGPGSGGQISTQVTMTTSWALVTITYTHPVGGVRQSLRLNLSTTAAITNGQTVDLDAVFVETGATAGTYLDPSSSLAGHTITWAGTTENSPTLIVPTPTGTYTRPVDSAAPQLGLPGSKWVHKRAGALTVGDRISAPLALCSYSLATGRLFTIAAWVKVTPTLGSLPSFRWVVEFLHESFGAGYTPTEVYQTMTSEPFSPAGQYARFSHTLTYPTLPYLATSLWATSVRVHLEVVNAGTIGAGAEVSIRGAHMYAGADRGDTAGLAAVTVPLRVGWQVVIPTADAFKVTRVDVHGNDRISQITAATVTINSVATSVDLYGGSAGRLTVRVPPGTALGLASTVTVWAEETSAGPGGQLSLQSIQAWHEVDATADLVGLTVDRSADVDPADSTVPIGNYAASVIDLEIDDEGGEWSLFSREYIDLGHRIEAAVGVTYTNRCDDPLGIDAAAAGAASLTWPTALFGTSPVVPVAVDRFEQLPPAPYVGHATAQLAYDTPMRVTAPALEGWSMRGQVWVRYTGDIVPALYVAAVRRYEVPGTGVVNSVDPATAVDLPFTAAANTWTLVKLPTVVVPTGSNAVALSGGFGISDAGRFLEFAAPDFVRVDPTTGDVIEVVETAPAGVYTSTGWDAGTGGVTVNVSGIDRLATAGPLGLASEIHVNTTVEAELRDIARRYLDLGSDQVVIYDSGTPITYAIPADKVSTQIADLAKAATLTAFTDGAGRFTGILRAEVDPDIGTSYLDDRNLLSASAALTPDVVRNEALVSAHPVAKKVNATLAVVGNGTPTDTSVAGWVLSGQELYVPSGTGNVEIIVEWDYDAALPGIGVEIVGWFDWQVGQANPFNVFSVGVGGVTPIPFPPGSNWGVTYTGGQSWAAVAVAVYPTFGRITFTNRVENPGPGSFTPPVYAPAYYIDRVRIVGEGLTVTNVTQRFVRSSSVDAFGSRPVEVDVRLAQSAAILAPVGADILDNYSLRESSGARWLPDLELAALGDPWRELGDRVIVSDPPSGIAGEYRVISHKLKVDDALGSDLYLRRVPTGLVFAITDVSLADDGKVTSY